MQRKLVLVVDDDLDLRTTVCEVLEDEGFAPLPAENGAQALEHLERHRPQVILLDLMMPVMNGWQFREAQLADARVSGIPVIVMTANRHFDPAPLAADALLLKPLQLESLLDAVRRHG